MNRLSQTLTCESRIPGHLWDVKHNVETKLSPHAEQNNEKTVGVFLRMLLCVLPNHRRQGLFLDAGVNQGAAIP